MHCPPDHAPLCYEIGEFADAHRVSHRHVYNEINSGRLKSIKFGRRRLIPVVEAQRWLAERLRETSVKRG